IDFGQHFERQRDGLGDLHAPCEVVALYLAVRDFQRLSLVGQGTCKTIRGGRERERASLFSSGLLDADVPKAIDVCHGRLLIQKLRGRCGASYFFGGRFFRSLSMSARILSVMLGTRACSVANVKPRAAEILSFVVKPGMCFSRIAAAAGS